MPSRKNFRSHIEARRESAKVRQQERKNRSDVDQIEKLTARGHIHCNEAKKIFAKIMEKS